VVIFLAVAVIVFAWVINPYWGTPFDKNDWAKALSCAGKSDLACVAHEQSCPRGRMIFSIRRFHLRVGMSSASVTGLLGDGRSTIAGVSSGRCMAWPLGMCSGLGMDYDFLVACFDDQSRLTETFLRQS